MIGRLLAVLGVVGLAHSAIAGTKVVYPDVALTGYLEHFDSGPTATSEVVKATVTVRVANDGAVKTAPVSLEVFDNHVAMSQTGGPSTVEALEPHTSVTRTLQLVATLPSPKQTTEGKEYEAYRTLYDQSCGADLKLTMTWRGPAAEAPPNPTNSVTLYQGAGGSNDSVTVCDDTTCVSLARVAQSICQQLRGKVIGYAFAIGNSQGFLHGGYGLARTPADAPATAFGTTTKMQIASSSKVLTALATISLVDLKGDKVGPMAVDYFPTSWPKPAAGQIVRTISFRHLISQKSGVQQYYASTGGQTYGALKAFFTQNIADPNSPRTCPGPARPATATSPAVPQSLPHPIVADKTQCYTDTNFGMMRILLARYAGTADNDGDALGRAYVKIVQDRVLKPVGVSAYCKASGQTALPYTLTPGVSGWDWGDLTSVCGDWGWFVSVDDYFKVLSSVNQGDGKIISPCQFYDMEHNAPLGTAGQPSDHAMGWDATQDGAYRYLEKNGADSWSQNGKAGSQTTSVAIFGGSSACGGGLKATPGAVGILFINSPVATVAGANPPGADTILRIAFEAAASPK